ncbi:hypothetical protein CFE70_010207 [Pyrenophora teres f. teres 0-1]
MELGQRGNATYLSAEPKTTYSTTAEPPSRLAAYTLCDDLGSLRLLRNMDRTGAIDRAKAFMPVSLLSRWSSLANCSRAKIMVESGVFSIQPQLLEATPDAVIRIIKPKRHIDAKYKILGYNDTGEHLATLASDQYHRFLNARKEHIIRHHTASASN